MESKTDVRELLDQVDATKKGNWAYYNTIKRELAWMCGDMSVRERVDFDLFESAQKELQIILEI
jgi:hypothetical protein